MARMETTNIGLDIADDAHIWTMTVIFLNYAVHEICSFFEQKGIVLILYLKSNCCEYLWT